MIILNHNLMKGGLIELMNNNDNIEYLDLTESQDEDILGLNNLTFDFDLGLDEIDIGI